MWRVEWLPNKILCTYCVVHIDVYKNITYTMKWMYMLALHASNVILAISAEIFFVASMLLICVAGIYYGVHNFLFDRDPCKS